MLTPVVCVTCGMPIADVCGLYFHLKAERVAAVLAESGTDPGKAAADNSLTVDCSDIFDKLGIVQLCCRKSMSTAMIYSNYY